MNSTGREWERREATIVSWCIKTGLAPNETVATVPPKLLRYLIHLLWQSENSLLVSGKHQQSDSPAWNLACLTPLRLAPHLSQFGSVASSTQLNCTSVTTFWACDVEGTADATTTQSTAGQLSLRAAFHCPTNASHILSHSDQQKDT